MVADDAYEENDSLAAAKNLGTLSGQTTINSLVMADSVDWYKFTTAAKPGTTDTVSITFQNSLGNLNLALFNSLGQQIRASSTTNNSEHVSLSGLASGTYYVKVTSYAAPAGAIVTGGCGVLWRPRTRRRSQCQAIRSGS